VGLNQAARSLLALHEHSLLFGFPIDRPQAGRWPLGSSALTEALRPLLLVLQRDEPPSEMEIALDGATDRVLKCSAARIIESGRPVGAVMTFRAAA
jgi:hypothetical protein